MDKILFINACIKPCSRTLELAENFFGITDVNRYVAEGLDIFGAHVDTIMGKAKQAIIAEEA